MNQERTAQFVSIYLLIRLYNAEGKRFFDMFKFSRTEWKKDLLWLIVFSIFAMPIVGAQPVQKEVMYRSKFFYRLIREL